VGELLPHPVAGDSTPTARPRKRRRMRPLVVDARGLARLLSSGKRTVGTWNAAGKIPAPIRIGGRVVWVVSEIRAWLAAGAPEREAWDAIRAART
jgi:prophage regulatory protein